MNIEALQEGVLCSLKMGRWNASVKIDPSRISEKAPREILRTMQDMISDRTILKALTRVRNQAKYVLTSNTLPFPIDNIWFVPKHKIEYLDTEFKTYQREYRTLTRELVSKYARLKKEFKEKYPEYYAGIESKYPTPAQLKSKFYFSWNFFHFTIPDAESDILPPSVYKREQRKFKNMVKEMEEMSLNLIGNMLFERVKKLEAQCEGDSINAATVHSVENFLEKWNDIWSGHVDQSKMRSIVKSLRHQMKKVTSDRLKNNEELRGNLGRRLGKIVGRIENVPNLTLKRRLDI